MPTLAAIAYKTSTGDPAPCWPMLRLHAHEGRGKDPVCYRTTPPLLQPLLCRTAHHLPEKPPVLRGKPYGHDVCGGSSRPARFPWPAPPPDIVTNLSAEHLTGSVPLCALRRSPLPLMCIITSKP